VARRKAASADNDVEKATTDSSKPVKFQIAADDDDEDKPAEGAHLLAKPPPPYIMIESPSSVKIAGDGNSPTNV